MTNLALRTIGIRDDAVIDDGHSVGRFGYAAERTNEVWMWNVTVAVLGGGHGISPGLEEAKSSIQGTVVQVQSRDWTGATGVCP